MFHNQTILITGGTGSWGQELTRNLLQEGPKEIRIFSRNEFSQVKMQRDFAFHPSLTFMIGDVRDQEAVEDACRNVDYVFHLAALKHVPICEAQPDEALKTNVKGTENVIRGSIRAGVKKVIDVSTDKAVDPINFYGMTKALGEKLMVRANDLSSTTQFVCIRGGNVLGTNGSVVPFFKNRILQGEALPLTHKDMTRFFLTLPEAIELLLSAAKAAVGGETFVMKMNACLILDLAEVLMEQLSDQPLSVKDVGIRPGEKLHEVLISSHEIPFTYQYNEKYFVILPANATPSLYDHYSHLPKTTFTQYASNDSLMTSQEILQMLLKGGFLP
ncbi:polysaccharide biosynthesis protein [Paenibacillus sp. CGMCC 1.16610]|uniref:NAD-dependent epimerase/dehydratase family protein n=1 Tax=Paenibacillus anseongense TaxID=2682845 RepID=A0ABW9UKC1_9BACL|nr:MULTISPECIES: polysaccharide biosynthesis protein [Paenibacillus]MBA2938490.1 polysaccharide biosynthesis protein [Paenibacillus sp. CGMCC 1.16610]MVQ39608.1 NAD-dependent epimerase/dehydratase family protein [Paenibacillus anseongense]